MKINKCDLCLKEYAEGTFESVPPSQWDPLGLMELVPAPLSVRKAFDGVELICPPCDERFSVVWREAQDRMVAVARRIRDGCARSDDSCERAEVRVLA